jgi:hypothetical protein
MEYLVDVVKRGLITQELYGLMHDLKDKHNVGIGAIFDACIITITAISVAYGVDYKDLEESLLNVMSSTREACEKAMPAVNKIINKNSN